MLLQRRCRSAAAAAGTAGAAAPAAAPAVARGSSRCPLWPVQQQQQHQAARLRVLCSISVNKSSSSSSSSSSSAGGDDDGAGDDAPLERLTGGGNDVVSSSSSSSSSGADDAGLEAFKRLIGDQRRFMCLPECGRCCTGDGEVWVDANEAAAIAAHLGLPLRRFHQLYTHAYSKRKGWHLLRARDDDPARPCVFLNPGDNRCRVHEVKPSNCRTYPWWPDLVGDARRWQWERDNICPGMDHPEAPPLDVDAAARQLREATAVEVRWRLALQPGANARRQKGGGGGVTEGGGSGGVAEGGGAVSAASSAAVAGSGGGGVSWQQRLRVMESAVLGTPAFDVERSGDAGGGGGGSSGGGSTSSSSSTAGKEEERPTPKSRRRKQRGA